jgi:hypothetical protein
VSHSVHLKAPPPDAGPFFESRAAHHRAALSPATPAEYQPPQTGSQFWISCDIRSQSCCKKSPAPGWV